MIPQSITLGASAIPLLINARELGRTKRFANSAGPVIDPLIDQLDARVKQISPGRPDPQVLVNENVPTGFVDALKNPNKFASIRTAVSKEGTPLSIYDININPNADRAYFAHELGHAASKQTDVGGLVNRLRHNPKLSAALGGAMLGIPIAASALEEGDDDLDTSLATAMLAASPTIVDEALASKNALAIMDSAGMRASLGQRGKLAGGLLSYVAPALVAGIGGNYIGNQFDNEQTPGELNPQ